MTETEVKEGVDTDDEEDPIAWEITTRRKLASLPNASQQQIDFMFLWDRFMADHVWPYADYKVPTACQLFAWKMRSELQDMHCRRWFLTHLHALFMFKLLHQAEINSCIEIIGDDKQADPWTIHEMEGILGYAQIDKKRAKTNNGSKLQ